MGEHPRRCEPLPSVGIVCTNLSVLVIGRAPRINRKLCALNANIFSLLSLEGLSPAEPAPERREQEEEALREFLRDLQCKFSRGGIQRCKWEAEYC